MSLLKHSSSSFFKFSKYCHKKPQKPASGIKPTSYKLFQYLSCLPFQTVHEIIRWNLLILTTQQVYLVIFWHNWLESTKLSERAFLYTHCITSNLLLKKQNLAWTSVILQNTGFPNFKLLLRSSLLTALQFSSPLWTGHIILRRVSLILCILKP